MVAEIALQVETVVAWILGIVTGIWLVAQFALTRENEPRAELQLDVYLVGVQERQRLVEVVATLANRGFVRHRYDDFRVIVRYLLPKEPIRDAGENSGHELVFPHSTDARIDGRKRFFANTGHVDPRLSARHSYITFVPAEATFLLVQCSLNLRVSFQHKPVKRQIQRLVRVGP